MTSPFNIVVALKAEAKPLVAHFGLAFEAREGGISLYRREQRHLLVSGAGNAQMIAAVNWLAARQTQTAVWLNAGVAGHGTLPVGTVFRANAVTDVEQDRSWHLPQVVRLGLPGSALYTVGRPETRYAEPAGYDMEAAGFVECASRVSPAELVQVVKVVSDGPLHPVANLNGSGIGALMQSGLDAFQRAADRLLELAGELDAAPAVDTEWFTERWHFSVTRQRQLSTLLRQWAVTFGTPPAEWPPLLTVNTAGDAIAALRERLLGEAPNY